jgi:hypothetical protein
MSVSTRPRRERERGQVLVIVAGGVITLLLILGLVIDGGIAVFNRRDGQNVADVAALAGAQEVANFHTGKDLTPNTWAAIDDSVTANGCSAGASVPCSWRAWYVGPGSTGPVDLGAPMTSATPGNPAVPTTALGVRVQVDRQPGTFLSRLAQIEHWDVTTQATAIAWRPRVAPPGQLLPIAFKADPAGYEPGQVYDITEGKDAPGGFGYISWDGSNDAGALADSLCEPNNPEFYLPYSFPSDPGKTNANDVRHCLDEWINDDPDSDPGSGQVVLIPIYDTVSGTGNNTTYNIIGIASFILTARDQPAVDNIRGYFVEIYPFTDPVPGGIGSQPPTPTDTSFPLVLVR